MKTRIDYGERFFSFFGSLCLPISFVINLKGLMGGISANSTWSSGERFSLVPGGNGGSTFTAALVELKGAAESDAGAGSDAKTPAKLPPRSWYSKRESKSAVANKQASRIFCFISSFFHPALKIPTIFCLAPLVLKARK